MNAISRIEPGQRTLPQNALFHALIAEAVRKGIAADNGRRLTFAEAKVAFVAAWMLEEEGEDLDIIAFGGRPVQLKCSTRELNTAEFNSLVEFVYAECAQRGIVLEDRRP